MATTLPGTGTPISTDPLTTLNGAAASASEVIQRMKLSTGAAGTATDVGSANPLPMQITSGTTAAGVEPFGALIANAGYQTLFYESWSVSPIDTTDKWTVTGTAPTIAAGNMQMAATASTYNAIRTKDTVRPNVGFSLVRNGIQLETSAATGCGRFWGLGTPASVPAAISQAQDGIGFEIDQAAGTLLAVTYAAGVRTTVATLTRPADGAIHAYGLYFRVTQAYWILDGAVVASQSFPNVQVVELPALIVRQNAAAFVGVPTFTNIAHLTADTSRQGVLIADPVIGTRQARVSAAGGLSVSGPAGAALALDGTDITTPTAMPAGGVGIRGWLSAIWTKLNGTLGVTGTFFQATQPVSLATNTPDVTDRSARLLGTISNTTFAATNAGTFAVQSAATLAAETTKVIGTVNLSAAQTLATITTVTGVTTVGTLTTLANGQTAHSSASTGSPVRVAGRVNTAVDTTLVAGDASDLFMTSSGALVQKPFSAPELDWTFASAAGGIINTTDVVLKAAGAAGVRNYLTGLTIQNASATTATEVVIKDGVAIIGRYFVGAQTLLNSVVGLTFATPLRSTAATALNVACITTAAAVYVNAQGFQAP